MAKYKWVRESFSGEQDTEAIYGRMPGDAMAKLLDAQWTPTLAVADPKHPDSVMVLMRRPEGE